MARLPFRVYYEDTDFSGFVYHARYLHFFERARTDSLRACGLDQRAMFEAEGGPLAFVVRHLSIDYLSPARMDDMVEVETRVTQTSGASVKMHQTLYRGTEVLARGDVTIVYLKAGRPTRIDAALKSAFIALQ
jgi:acyl-CoA thioester hydrolase